MNVSFHPPLKSVADLLHQLGDVPAARVRMNPVPGTATIDDLLKPGNDHCELVDGTLVEKAVGWEESFLSIWLSTAINIFVQARKLGVVSGEAGFLELPSGPVRAPDVAFTSWERVRSRPRTPIPRMAPDLAVEVLSESNTPREMARKRDEYFRAGVRLVWEVDPRARAARVYTGVDQFRDLGPADVLDGGDILPGFSVPLADLFAELDHLG